jgi:hypothetical protein
VVMGNEAGGTHFPKIFSCHDHPASRS